VRPSQFPITLYNIATIPRTPYLPPCFFAIAFITVWHTLKEGVFLFTDAFPVPGAQLAAQ
jgi:hypothetical protein